MEPHFLEARAKAASDQLDILEAGTSEYAQALIRLTAVAEEGSADAAEHLAEILAHQGPHHDAAAAYKWYFIVLSQQGYLTDFDEQNEPPEYAGPTGDFRNESMVSMLVDELGFERIRALDKEAAAWLAARNLSRTK